MLLRSLTLLVLILGAACWVEPDPAPTTPRTSPSSPSPTPSPSGSGSSSAAPAPSAPLVVEIDTGRTLKAEAGQGVGIFVEYAAGGKWNVWWTCDTAQTGAACDFSVQISGTGIVSPKTSGVLASDSVAFSGGRILARSQTGSNIVGVLFDAPPGGTITIDASIGGVRDPAYFFFVQDGQPNGGFTGALSNPLAFRGRTP